MVLFLVGAALVALGLFSGALLVAGPLGLAPGMPSLTLWLLFPLFTLAGYALAVIGARSPRLRGLSFAIACLLLLLAVAAAVALVLAAAALIAPVDDTFSLWYVLAVGGVLGALGAAPRGDATAAH